MARTLGIDELMRVAFVLEDFRQSRVGDYPIAAAFGRRLGSVIVLRNLNPQSKRLLLTGGEEVLDVFIGAERRFGTVAKVYESPE